MNASMHTETAGRKLAHRSPWLLIAILLHVGVIAVASILYFEHGSAPDDSSPTTITLTAARPLVEMPPIEIIDHNLVPKMQEDEDIVPNELTFDPEAATDSEASETGDPLAAELASMPGDNGGGTAIGRGPGVYCSAPSGITGKPGGPFRARFNPAAKKSTGIGEAGSKAVRRGLEWLRAHQDEDGHWDADQFMKHDKDGEPCTGPGNGTHDVGVTGLALLAFLGEGNTLRQGHFRQVVRKGVRWLTEQQNESGLVGTMSSQSFLYSHALATLALCEAYGLSDYRPLREPAQRAANYITLARNPYGVWRYELRSVDGDSSISAWMVQALLSAKSFGLQVDDSSLKNATVFFDGVTDPATGAAGYTKAGEGSSRPVGKADRFPAAKTEALTSAVLLCRCLLHHDQPNDKVMQLATDRILKQPPVWNEADGSIDMYYWYYASYAMFQVSGKPWDTWSRKMKKAVVDTQQLQGNACGSWNPVDAWGDEGGRVYSTAMMVLCLEAYYRYDRVLGAR